MIEKIANPYTRQTMLDRFIKLVSKARKTPNDRAHSFNVIKSLVGKIAEQVVDIETKVRDEVGGVPRKSWLFKNRSQNTASRFVRRSMQMRWSRASHGDSSWMQIKMRMRKQAKVNKSARQISISLSNLMKTAASSSTKPYLMLASLASSCRSDSWTRSTTTT